jgi:hypothetical protein
MAVGIASSSTMAPTMASMLLGVEIGSKNRLSNGWSVRALNGPQDQDFVTSLAVVDANGHPNRKRRNKRADLRNDCSQHWGRFWGHLQRRHPGYLKRALCLVTENESWPMAFQKVQTMAEMREPESPPKAMGLLKAALTATVPAKASPKEPLKLSAKAQTRGFLKAALTSTAPAKALRKEPLKADRIAMEPGKVMALMEAPWKLMVSVRKPKKAELTELASWPMAS